MSEQENLAGKLPELSLELQNTAEKWRQDIEQNWELMQQNPSGLVSH
jgi:hypothetical protein